MSIEQKLALLEEIRARRIPVIKSRTSRSKASTKGVKRQRKPRSIEEALAYMNEKIANMNMENESHD